MWVLRAYITFGMQMSGRAGSLSWILFQILIRVLSIRFGDEWYFGRVTALSLSGVIHQPVSTYYVINKHRSKVIDSKLFGKVVLIKISANTGKPYGVLEQSYRGIPYYLSSIQRNLTDYLYLYTHGHADLDQIKDIYMNYRGMMNQDDLLELMYKCYQKNSAIKMVFVLKMVTK